MKIKEIKNIGEKNAEVILSANVEDLAYLESALNCYEKENQFVEIWRLIRDIQIANCIMQGQSEKMGNYISNICARIKKYEDA